MLLATSPALCPPMPSASTAKPISASAARLSSFSDRMSPGSVTHASSRSPIGVSVLSGYPNFSVNVETKDGTCESLALALEELRAGALEVGAFELVSSFRGFRCSW